MSSTQSTPFATPQKGISMMLAFRMTSKVTLIFGSNTLAASRAFAALESDSQVIVAGRGGIDAACSEIKWRVDTGEIEFLQLDAGQSGTPSLEDCEISVLDALLASRRNIALVCVTDTLDSTPGASPRSRRSAERIHCLCRRRNVPVNVTDIPSLCDFTFAATHRFTDLDTGLGTPLQIGVTTNGKGCRLSGRIKRDLVALMPREAGTAVEKIGNLRSMAMATPHIERVAEENELNDEMTVLTPNRPVPQRSESESAIESARRRMKWVAQISEYWPISKLAKLSEQEMYKILDAGLSSRLPAATLSEEADFHFYQRLPDQLSTVQLRSPHGLVLDQPPKKNGRIYLVGSGPGHPSLLTIATHAVLTKYADLVLTDKLVPAAVLELIPKHVEVRVARKFPGNAEQAQTEMMEAAVEAAQQGKTVVRLKQGDPMLYGRAGEEVLYFRQHGYEALVIPGVTSALAAPTLGNIPVTQRGVSESLIVCTGVGRKGKDVKLPGYERGRTLVILMGVARLPQMLEALLASSEKAIGRRDGPSYLLHTPIALVERASMPDQRVVTSTLQHISEAVESMGEQRPPGLLVIGWSVLALWGQGDVTVLDEAYDQTCVTDTKRVERWLEGARWRIQEGLSESWDIFDSLKTSVVYS